MAFASLLEAFESLDRRRREDPASLGDSERSDLKRMRSEIESILFGNQPAGAERREHLRVPVCMQARYWTSNELRDRYISVIGEGGLFIATQEPLPVGSSIDLEIVLVERRFSMNVSGKVAWINAGRDPSRRGMGIRFTGLTYEQKTVLYDLVRDAVRGRMLERRRYTRLDSRLPVSFVYQEGTFRLPTTDLSVDGAFVASDHLLDVGERVKLNIKVPGSPDPVRAVATVVRADEKRTPGMPAGIGLHFRLMNEEGRKTILDYLLGRVSGSFDKAETGEKRRLPRIKRRIKVSYATDANGQNGTSYCRDISGRGVFIRTPEPPPVGSRVLATIEHPVTRQRLPVQGKVVRTVYADPAKPHCLPGAAVLFTSQSASKREMLKQFFSEFILMEGPAGRSKEPARA